MRPSLCGLDSAFGDTEIITSVAGGIITTTTVESDVEPHSKWTPGFRIGADLALSCFDLMADWTHYNGRADFDKDNQYGRWKIRYDQWDLTLGRTFCTAPCFTLKPFIGVRGVLIHQSLKSHLETLFTALIGNNTVLTDKDDKENFWGVGPQLGLEAEWYLGCNFSLYGKVDAVSYYGKVHGENFDTDTFTSTVSVCNGKKHRCFNTFASDAEIGIRWDRTVCFCNCKVNYLLMLGLEQHRIYDFSELGSDGTMSLDGAVFGVGINFCY